MPGLDESTTLAIVRLTEAIQQQTAYYQNEKKKDEDDKGYDTFLDEVKKIYRDAKTTQKDANREFDIISNNAETINEAASAFSKLNIASESFREDFEQLSENLLDSNTVLGEALRTEITELLELSKTTKLTSVQMDTLLNVMEGAERGTRKVAEQAKVSLDTMQMLNKTRKAGIKALKKYTKHLFKASTMLAYFTAQAIIYADTLQDSMKRQVPIMDAFGVSVGELAARYKLNVKGLMESSDQYSTMLLQNSKTGSNMRQSTVQYLANLDIMNEKMRQITGSYDAGNRLLMGSYDLLSRVGVDTTFDSLIGPGNDLAEAFGRLARSTNLNADELLESTNQLMSSAEIRNTMLMLDKKERLGFPAKLLQEYEIYRARGMELDQIQETIKTLSGLTIDDPEDVLKDATTIMSVAAAMGMKDIPNLVDLMLKSPDARTDDEKNTLLDFSKRLFQQQREMQKGGQENISSKLAVSKLWDTIQGSTLEALRAQDTEGLQKLEGDVKDDNILTPIQKIADTVYSIGQGIKAFFDDPALKMIGTFVGMASLLLKFTFGLAALPALLIAGLVTAAGLVIITYRKEIGEFIGGLAYDFTSWLNQTGKDLGSWVYDMVQIVSKGWNDLTKYVSDTITNIGNTLSDLVDKITNSIGVALKGLVPDSVKGVWDYLTSSGDEDTKPTTPPIEGANDLAASISAEFARTLPTVLQDISSPQPNNMTEKFGEALNTGISTLTLELKKEREAFASKIGEIQRDNMSIQREMLDVLKTGNGKVDKTNDTLNKGNEEKRKGNIIRNKQASSETIRLRTNQAKGAFLLQPNPT